MKNKTQVYEEALINIWKRGGVCWDGTRQCADSQHVAMLAIKKNNPQLFKFLGDLQYTSIRVSKTGRVTYPKKGFKNA
jgi:hypothetical protein